MTSTKTLTGHALIDCAKANSNISISVAAKQSGYGNDIKAFRAALNKAFQDMGVSTLTFEDLKPFTQA